LCLWLNRVSVSQVGVIIEQVNGSRRFWLRVRGTLDYIVLEGNSAVSKLNGRPIFLWNFVPNSSGEFSVFFGHGTSIVVNLLRLTTVASLLGIRLFMTVVVVLCSHSCLWAVLHWASHLSVHDGRDVACRAAPSAAAETCFVLWFYHCNSDQLHRLNLFWQPATCGHNKMSLRLCHSIVSQWWCVRFYFCLCREYEDSNLQKLDEWFSDGQKLTKKLLTNSLTNSFQLDH